MNVQPQYGGQVAGSRKETRLRMYHKRKRLCRRKLWFDITRGVDGPFALLSPAAGRANRMLACFMAFRKRHILSQGPGCNQ